MPDDDPGATPSDDRGGATPPASTPPAKGEDALGDAGKKALDAEREARKAAEARVKELEARDLTDLEKRDKRIKELEEENATLVSARQQDRIRSATVTAATKAGFWDPELAVALISPGDVAFDRDGNPRNVEALVAAIAKERPKLVNGSGSQDFGAGHRGGAPGTVNDEMNARIRSAAGRG